MVLEGLSLVLTPTCLALITFGVIIGIILDQSLGYLQRWLLYYFCRYPLDFLR